MAVVEYVLPLGENARKRHSHETVKGAVVTFVVQLSFADALTVADEDIQDRWEEYHDRYLRGEWP